MTHRQCEALMAKPILEKPEKLGRYQTDFTEVKLIGKGHFGEVYECVHNLDRSKYAVKLIQAHKQRPHSVTRGLAEARALAAIEDTRYVVRYHSVWLEKNSLYIAMELCQATLTACVQAAGTTEELMQKVLHDVLKGLKMMHQRGRVHLDVKPDNILLGQNGRFKLADFGLSRVVAEKAADILEGDARYLAPELLNGLMRSPIDLDLPKADIFSLGASLLELLRQSRLPNNGPEWHSIRNDEFQLPSCSQELSELITLMLARNPEQRPTAEQALLKLSCRGSSKKQKIE